MCPKVTFNDVNRLLSGICRTKRLVGSLILRVVFLVRRTRSFDHSVGFPQFTMMCGFYHVVGLYESLGGIGAGLVENYTTVSYPSLYQIVHVPNRAGQTLSTI